MKRLALAAPAFLLAFLLVELVVAELVGFPREGRDRLIGSLRGPHASNFLYRPRSRYWNVEGGNRAFARNNLGLPGVDVPVRPGGPCLFVLGSSTVQAAQLEPELIATSRLQRMLAGAGRHPAVLNLGDSGHDPYESWFRARYFERLFRPVRVVLVLDTSAIGYMNSRYREPPAYELPADFGRELPSGGRLSRISRGLRARSAFVNLLAVFLMRSLSHGQAAEADELDIVQKNRLLERLPDSLRECLRRFRDTYGRRFLALSIMDVPDHNRSLARFCAVENIPFAYTDTVLVPGLRFHGRGHLTAAGNRALAEFMHEIISRYAE